MNLEKIDLSRAYEVSTKGLCLDNEDKILVVKDVDGWWELPGGGLNHGEDIVEGLKRECREELGVECKVLDQEPYKVWVGITPKGTPRLILLFRIQPLSFEFRKTRESEEIVFVDKKTFKSFKLVPQLNKLKEIL